MQLLDDDMDELFRNAASDYPLNTDGGDWEAMRNKLQQAENNQQGTATNRLGGRWWFNLGLLLILTAVLMIVAVSGLFNGKRTDVVKGDIILHKPGQQVTEGQQPDAQARLAQISPSGVVKTNSPLTGTVKGRPIERLDLSPMGNSGTPGQQPHTTGKTWLLTRTKQGATNSNNIVKGNKAIIDREDHLNTHEHVVIQQGEKVTDREGRFIKEDSEQSGYPATRPGITFMNMPLSIERIQGNADKNILPETGIKHVERQPNIPAGVLPDSSTPAPNIPVKRKSVLGGKGLYYGLVISPDLTTVKLQRTANVGYNIGLLAGYRFSKKLAVETGILYERKYYYSIGKYFDTKKTPWPTNMKVLNVDGWCNMFEIPVNVRFTFATGAKSSWYANAGMSSYIMKKQQYDYSYEYYGQPQTRNWSYKKTTTDLFSIIHLGVGYERPVGRLGSLRVEPYVKIPASGIGIGDLPITSVGLNIGLTRPLRLK
jgi:hypothetical protein